LAGQLLASSTIAQKADNEAVKTSGGFPVAHAKIPVEDARRKVITGELSEPRVLALVYDEAATNDAQRRALVLIESLIAK
jgi:hypothetical protein